jgi:hypothetical protein
MSAVHAALSAASAALAAASAAIDAVVAVSFESIPLVVTVVPRAKGENAPAQEAAQEVAPAAQAAATEAAPAVPSPKDKLASALKNPKYRKRTLTRLANIAGLSPDATESLLGEIGAIRSEGRRGTVYFALPAQNEEDYDSDDDFDDDDSDI